jgi:broad specificity phosphatase PhoE
MFALIRHAGYHIPSGSLTPEGIQVAERVAGRLNALGVIWKEARASPAHRTTDTGKIITGILEIPLETDERLSTDGNLVELLPPTEPNDIIFVTHLPVITKMLRTWSRFFHQDEPPLTEVGGGYLVDPITKRITSI